MVESSKSKIAVDALVEWLGEAIVGLIPLIAFKIISLFSSPMSKIYLCPLGMEKLDLPNCILSKENASQEVCILTVVISGLAMWSVLCGKSLRLSVYSRLSLVFCLLSLLAGALMYALFAEHIAENANGFSYAMLVLALASSLSLHIERAVFDRQDLVAKPEATA